MPRIRTIKPEFWSDEKVVKLSLAARLLFIGLWNFSDDSGCYWYEPERLAMQVFPRDTEINVAVLIDELLGEKMLELRERQDGREYVIVHHFPQHQKIDHPTASRIQTMTYKKKSIPFAARRALALKYWAEPGGEPKIVHCHYCREEGVITWPKKSNGEPGAWVHFTLEIDHVNPEKAGGAMEVENLVLSCRSCNRSKGTKSAEEFTNDREDSRGLAPEEEGKRKGREGKKDNNRGEDAPDNPQDRAQQAEQIIKAAATSMTVTGKPDGAGAGDWGGYRLPRNMGSYGWVHLESLSAADCRYVLEKMRPGPKVREALNWRIKIAEAERAR